MTKEAFIGTGVVCAVIVDAVRLPLSLNLFAKGRLRQPKSGVTGVIVAARFAAFGGSFLGTRRLRKVTPWTAQAIAATGMVGIAVLKAAGIV